MYTPFSALCGSASVAVRSERTHRTATEAVRSESVRRTAAEAGPRKFPTDLETRSCYRVLDRPVRALEPARADIRALRMTRY